MERNDLANEEDPTLIVIMCYHPSELYFCSNIFLSLSKQGQTVLRIKAIVREKNAKRKEDKREAHTHREKREKRKNVERKKKERREKKERTD